MGQIASVTFNGSISYISAIMRAVQSIAPDGSVAGNAAQAMTAIMPPPNPGSGAPNSDHIDDGPVNPNAPTSDAQGVLWDERIHSKNKGLNADNTWRKRRGVSAELVTQVENELKAKAAGQAQMYMPPQQPMQMPPGYPPPSGLVAQPAPPPMQMPPGYPPPSAPLPPPAAAPQMDLQAFMQHLAGKMQQINPATNAPMIDNNYLISVVQRTSQHTGKPFNVITDIASDANAMAVAIYFMQADGRW